MARMPSVGQELLNTPFDEMVAKLAMAIATAQQALDENSINTATVLADTDIDLVLGVTQTIDAQGNVTFENAPETRVSLMQIGLLPTFYNFSEATIEVTMDIKMTTSQETNIKVSTTAKVGFKVWSASVTADVSHNRKFGQEVRGTSRLFTRLAPVPPPPRIAPELTVVDNRPPAVSPPPPPAPPTPGGGT